MKMMFLHRKHKNGRKKIGWGEKKKKKAAMSHDWDESVGQARSTLFNSSAGPSMSPMAKKCGGGTP